MILEFKPKVLLMLGKGSMGKLLPQSSADFKLAMPSSITGYDGEYSESDNTVPAGPLQEARDPMK